MKYDEFLDAATKAIDEAVEKLRNALHGMIKFRGIMRIASDSRTAYVEVDFSDGMKRLFEWNEYLGLRIWRPERN